MLDRRVEEFLSAAYKAFPSKSKQQAGPNPSFAKLSAAVLI